MIAIAEPAGDTAVRPRAAVGWSGLPEGADPWDGNATLTAAPAVVTGQVAASAADLAALDAALDRASSADPRLATFRTLIAPTLERLLTALATRFSNGPALAALLRLF